MRAASVPKVTRWPGTERKGKDPLLSQVLALLAVPKRGLEPPLPEREPGPEPGASASSATSATALRRGGMDAVIIIPQAAPSSLPAASSAGFAEHGDHDGALARVDVALQVEDLLPGAEHRPAAAHRHRQRRPQQRGLKVRVAVAVVPRLFVAVVAARRHQAVEQFGQVLLQPRLELDGADRRRAADVEDMDDPDLDARIRHD